MNQPHARYPLLPALLFASTLLATAIVPADDSSTPMPMGGWRASEPRVADFMQDVHYPAVSVNDGGKQGSALISGSIARNPKFADGHPRLLTLIVNGNALPMPVQGNSYARPYAFGNGSNSVEVRDEDGTVLRRTQFIEANTAKVPSRLRVILDWDTDHTDVDLHVIAPDGEHTWYGDRVTASGALDIDVTDGYGPEIFSGLAPPEGTYLVYANYYGGDSGEDITTAHVTVVQNENTLREKRENFTVPLRRPGDLNFVTRFIFQRQD